MKTAILLAGLLAAVAATPARADFIGVTDPENFSVANVGTLIGGSPVLGSATFALLPGTLTLRGSDSTSPDPQNNATGCVGGAYADFSGPCQLQAVIGLRATYSFDWSYTSNDADGAPGDIFGVIVDGVRIPISDLGGANNQAGSATFFANTSFGWFMNCTDCINGNAVALISNFDANLPEPGTVALMLAAASAALLGRRRAVARTC